MSHRRFFSRTFATCLFDDWLHSLEKMNRTPVGLICAGEKPSDGKLGMFLYYTDGFPPDEMAESLEDLARQVRKGMALRKRMEDATHEAASDASPK